MKLVLSNSTDYANMVTLDSIPPIEIQITNDDDSVYDLTSHEVKLNFNKALGTSAAGYGTNIFSKSFIITNAENGNAEYRWERTATTNDISEPGTFYYDVVVIGPAVLVSVGTPTADSDNTGDDVAGTDVTSAGTYTGLQDTAYIIEVTTGGAVDGTAKVTISGSGGEAFNGTIEAVTGASAIDLGSLGATVTFVAGGTDTVLTLGDKFFVVALSASPGFRKTLTPTPNTIIVRASLA